MWIAQDALSSFATIINVLVGIIVFAWIATMLSGLRKPRIKEKGEKS